MRDVASIRSALQKAANEKRLVSFKFPHGGDLVLAVEQIMVDQALSAWSKEIPTDGRERTMGSVMRAIKRASKRLKKGRLADAEMDALASDATIWLGHELLFGDGERHLVKGPDAAVIADKASWQETAQ